MKVVKADFDALLARIINTPASAKDGIKKPKTATGKYRTRKQASQSTPRI